jgi:hypothetical protein
LDWKGMCEKAWKVNSVKAYITNDDTFFWIPKICHTSSSIIICFCFHLLITNSSSIIMCFCFHILIIISSE